MGSRVATLKNSIIGPKKFSVPTRNAELEVSSYDDTGVDLLFNYFDGAANRCLHVHLNKSEAQCLAEVIGHYLKDDKYDDVVPF